MKSMNLNKLFLVAALLFMTMPVDLNAQEDEKSSLFVNVGYYAKNNQLAWLMMETRTKVEKKFKAVPGVKLRLYLDSAENENYLIGTYVTDEKGIAKAVLPQSLRDAWNASERHSFIAVADETKQFEAGEGSIEVAKAKMAIDTFSDGETKTIEVTVLELQNGEWTPVADAEVKVGIARLGSVLPVNEESSFTTDSSGKVTAEFARPDLPGDSKGDIVLVAQVNEHEILGNVSAELKTPWGIPAVRDHSFFHRALWATRDRTPIWLMVMAYSIIGTIWGILIYLVFQLFRLKKLSKANSDI